MKKSRILFLMVLVGMFFWSCNTQSISEVPIKDLRFGANIGTPVAIGDLKTLPDGVDVNVYEVTAPTSVSEGTNMKFSFSIPNDSIFRGVKVSPAQLGELSDILAEDWAAVQVLTGEKGFDTKIGTTLKDVVSLSDPPISSRKYYVVEDPANIAWKTDTKPGLVWVYHPSAFVITYKMNADAEPITVRILVHVSASN